MIEIKNTKMFKNGIWRNPKTIKWMKKNCLYLKNTDLKSADLMGADLSGADLSGADLSFSDLMGANLSDANLNGVDLSMSYISGTNLKNASLRGANLEYASLTSTDLREADLSYVNLKGAKLSCCDLSKSILNNTNLNEARYIYWCNLYKIKTNYPVYWYSLTNSLNMDVVYIPTKDVVFLDFIFKGTLKDSVEFLCNEYSSNHPIIKDYELIIQHFKNLENVRKGY